MQTDTSNSVAVNSAWGEQQAHHVKGGHSQDFASHLAKNGLAAGNDAGGRSGGQLLSDDMSRALASYAPVNGAALASVKK